MIKKQYYDIALLGVIGITLVVFGHSLPSRFSYSSNVKLLSNVIEIIYIFHMPLFFYISGYLSKSSTNKNIYHEIKSKFKRLIIPYLVFSLLAYMAKAPLNEFAGRPLEFGVFDFVYRLFIPWDNPVIFYWFLPTLFFVTIGYLTISRCFSIFLQYYSPNILCNSKVIALFTLIFLVTCYLLFPDIEHKAKEAELLNVTGILYYLPFFVLGRLIGGFNRDSHFILSILSLAVSVFVVYFFFDDNRRVLAGIIIISLHLFCFTCIRFIGLKGKGVLDFIYKNNMTIYILSFFFQVPIGFIVFSLSSSATSMVLFSFISGFFCPIVAKLLITKVNAGRNFIKLAGI